MGNKSGRLHRTHTRGHTHKHKHTHKRRNKYHRTGGAPSPLGPNKLASASASASSSASASASGSSKRKMKKEVPLLQEMLNKRTFKNRRLSSEIFSMMIRKMKAEGKSKKSKSKSARKSI